MDDRPLCIYIDTRIVGWLAEPSNSGLYSQIRNESQNLDRIDSRVASADVSWNNNKQKRQKP